MGDVDPDRIPNDAHRARDVPGRAAPWEAIATFARSFDGAERPGGVARAAAIADRWEATFNQQGALPATLDDLRTCLFFEQRRWCHFGQPPDAAAMRCIHGLLATVRRLVRASPSRKAALPTARTTRSSPATRRRRLRNGRKRVLVYQHDSQCHTQHRWTLDRLLRMIQQESPVLDEDPDRTFVVGDTRSSLPSARSARSTSWASILC